MTELQHTIDVLVEARHRLIRDSALEMNRMSEYMSYLKEDCPKFKAIQNIMSNDDFKFYFNNDNYINSYMIDVSYNDNDLYQLIASNYDLFLSLTTEIKKIKNAMFESYLLFWDSFIQNSYENNNNYHNKYQKYILQKCDSLLIINGYIRCNLIIPQDIIYLIDKFYKSFSFQKCNPLMNFELTDKTNDQYLKFNHKFMYNGVVIIGHLFKSFRREKFKLSLSIKKAQDNELGLGFITPKYNFKLPIQSEKEKKKNNNHHCMFLFGNGNYLSSKEFNVFCKRTKWNDDLSLFKTNDDNNNEIITIEVNMIRKTAKIYNKNKSIIWFIKLPKTIAVAIYLNDEPKKDKTNKKKITSSNRIHSNSNKKVITITEQIFDS